MYTSPRRNSFIMSISIFSLQDLCNRLTAICRTTASPFISIPQGIKIALCLASYFSSAPGSLQFSGILSILRPDQLRDLTEASGGLPAFTGFSPPGQVNNSNLPVAAPKDRSLIIVVQAGGLYCCIGSSPYQEPPDICRPVCISENEFL